MTEAGFGSDLGAEKFFDIKCRAAGLKPDCVVLVATVRALKYNGGVKKENLTTPDVEALRRGSVNLKQHIENLQKFGLPVVVALNRFASDSDQELALLDELCREMDAPVCLTEVFAKGGEGGLDLAQQVLNTIQTKPSHFHTLYDVSLPVEEKVEILAKEIYRADGVDFTPQAKKSLADIQRIGLDRLPICVAKTQYSFSDDASKLGAPRNFRITVRDVKVSAGAGFIVIYTGNIMTMPGLPKAPSALNIDIDERGEIVGLF